MKCTLLIEIELEHENSCKGCILWGDVASCPFVAPQISKNDTRHPACVRAEMKAEMMIGHTADEFKEAIKTLELRTR
jgi:hypothetical protein